MATHHIGPVESKSDEWNAFVVRFLMHHGQESQRHARRIGMLEAIVLELCKDAPPSASFTLHKVASDLRAEAEKNAAEAEASLGRIEELAAMAYKFLSHREATVKSAEPRPAKPRSPAKRAPGAKKKKSAKKKG